MDGLVSCLKGEDGKRRRCKQKSCRRTAALWSCVSFAGCRQGAVSCGTKGTFSRGGGGGSPRSLFDPLEFRDEFEPVYSTEKPVESIFL